MALDQLFMEQKLQELTEKIYREGVGKAQEEADTILAKAREEAEKIVANARREAHQTTEAAEAAAEELRRNVTSEMQLSARQSISAIRQQITQVVTAQLIREPLREVFADQDFMRHIIEIMIKTWNPADASGTSLKLILPAEETEQLGAYFQSKAHELLQGGLEVQFSKNLGSGFRIGPGDGSYVLSFTEKDFENFFAEYLRPRIAKLLFEELKG